MATTVRTTPAPAPAAGAPSASDERRRQLSLFVGALAVVLAYPFIDAALGLRWMGSVIPIAVYVLLALGLNIVVGYAGLLDLGYAAFFAIGAYTTAFLTSPNSPLPFRTDFWIALALSWVVAAIFGVLLGAPTLRLRGDYLALVTLGFGEIVPRVILNADRYTGGSKGMNPIGRPSFFGYEFGNDAIPWYYLLIAVMLLSIFMILRLRDSRLGRAWMAMREDEIAAASMGIDLVRTKLLAFALGASFSGFAGAIFASYLQLTTPTQFDFSISVIVLCMVILGGRGNIWGVIVGGISSGSFDRVLADQFTVWIQSFGKQIGNPFIAAIDLSTSKMMIFGLALVLLMVLRPEGLFPSARRRAELHPENADILEQETESLPDVQSGTQPAPDVRGTTASD